MKIANREIKKNTAPFIIAEVSANHNGELSRAIEIMEAAKQAGAEAIKLQTYTADTITINHNSPDFIVDSPLWKGRTLYDIYKEAHTPWEWHKTLFAKGRELGIPVFASPFDFSSVEFLEELNTPAYKIASSELIDIPLIEKVAATGKPLIISTGMGSLEEIEEAVNAARAAGCSDIILLHCVSAYPTPFSDVNLTNITELAKKFDVITGLSDHTLGTAVSIAAVAMGAAVIEKHLTLSRNDGGVDSAFSIEPAELKQLVQDTRNVFTACGGPNIGPRNSEKGALKYRRSLYIVKDMEAGEIFDESNVRSIRPGYGLKPKHYRSIINRRASKTLKRGDALNWDMVQEKKF